MGFVMRRPDPHEVVVEDGKQEIDVLGVPGTGFTIDNCLDLSLSVYFATSMARLSRMTMTLTWPGYSS